MTALKKVYLGLGANLGDKLSNIHQAYEWIEKTIGLIVTKSSIYKSPPWGFDSKDDFYNSVILVETALEVNELLDNIQWIEKQLGKSSSFTIGYQSRIIDIDILDYNQEVITTQRLHLPHSHMEQRAFVLFPLKEVNSHWHHPISKHSINQLIKDFSNKEQLTTLEKLINVK